MIFELCTCMSINTHTHIDVHLSTHMYIYTYVWIYIYIHKTLGYCPSHYYSKLLLDFRLQLMDNSAW